MDRRYTILAILLIVAAFGLLILPNRIGNKEINPQKMLLAIDDPARFLSTDLVTERLIGRDPALQLIDVRPAAQFRSFALPGAVNIPLDSILKPQWDEVLHQPGKDKVFYSNGDIEADQAWQICKRKSLDHIYVMKGGLNFWFNTIIKGVNPPETAPSQDFDLYNFRLAARQYFTGSSANAGAALAGEQTTIQQPAEKITVIKRTSKPASGGGC